MFNLFFRSCLKKLILFLAMTAVHASAPFLSNIRQLTDSSMGFEKAGEAYFSPNGLDLIFQAIPKGEEHYQIYIMNIEERIPRRVSTGKGACTCGYFRPDGKKIIFASSHESPLKNEKAPKPEKYSWELIPYMNIYEANLDGSSLRALTNGSAYHAECGYSPDGTQIVYASNEDGSMNLYILNVDDLSSTKITHTDHCYNGGPFFSPDGTKIVFRADRDKKHYLQIHLIDPDGSNDEQLTQNNAVNWAPYWHPNGKMIAYTTSIHGHGAYEIYLINIETKNEHRLTYNPNFDGLPSFSLDGKKMLWTSKREENTCHIFMADFNEELIDD